MTTVAAVGRSLCSNFVGAMIERLGDGTRNPLGAARHLNGDGLSGGQWRQGLSASVVELSLQGLGLAKLGFTSVGVGLKLADHSRQWSSAAASEEALRWRRLGGLTGCVSPFEYREKRITASIVKTFA